MAKEMKGIDERVFQIELDEKRNPVGWIEKNLRNSKAIKSARILCMDYPSFIECVNNYVAEHKNELSLKKNGSLGMSHREMERQGYNGSSSMKKVIFYRIRDHLN